VTRYSESGEIVRSLIPDTISIRDSRSFQLALTLRMCFEASYILV
jgi:hypothetical protein